MVDDLDYLSWRRLPVGAELTSQGVNFRVWAPASNVVTLATQGAQPSVLYELNQEGNGYFSAYIANLKADLLYMYQLGNDQHFYPDPASRYQPFGSHGPSQVIDPNYPWTDQYWQGVTSKNNVLYEIHIGTFTKEGTWKAAAIYLEDLAELGITILQIMPIGEFSGRFGWGYDGINIFSPYHLYGTVNDAKYFINKAHRLGLAVILDVVYNHVGPDNHLLAFDTNFFSRKAKTDWGTAINYDDNANEIRQFIMANAYYWVDEFHFDGLRLDATQNIYDRSSLHILAEINKTLRSKIKHKKLYLIAENEPQNAQLIKPSNEDGYDFDGISNDDFHHVAKVRMLGRRIAYFTDYSGKAQEFVSAYKYGCLYQGQWYKWQNQKRGTSFLDIDPSKFIIFIENHDQIANSPYFDRIHAKVSPAIFRVITALLILSPQTPFIFQGQEFAASSSFHYFADNKGAIAQQVYGGRIKYMKQFCKNLSSDLSTLIENPSSIDTFLLSKLDHNEKNKNDMIYQLYLDLLKLRRNDAVFNKSSEFVIDGAVLSDDVFIIRYFAQNESRLVLVNFGVDYYFDPASSPLIALPNNMTWQICWTSEDPKYGGIGSFNLPELGNWTLTGNCLTVFKSIIL